MKLGYPCINRSIDCTANSTFRLANYSKERFRETVSNNIDCLKKILEYNLKHDILFFRISSDIIPFASHPVCDVNWQKEFKKEFAKIGDYIKRHDMRISMHPDQFVLINSLKTDIFKRSVTELKYHADVLNAMELDPTAKIQIHVGGVYGDKEKAIDRFINRYQKLPKAITERLAIENDDQLFSLRDCLKINKAIGIPIIFDTFHHSILNNGETIPEGLKKAAKTWKKNDGILMIDYSSQKTGHRIGTHTEHIDLKDFKNFLKSVKVMDFDIMLEIKDKEKSANKAVKEI